MDQYKIIQVKESVFADNDREADRVRRQLKGQGTFLLNLMSSPGSGKTTTLLRTVEGLKDQLRIGVMEADIDSDVDAAAMAGAAVRSIQLHTGGMCHLDAGMTEQGLQELGTEDLDLVVLENVGNLVCPAEFDTGAVKNAMILSVPEGHDKPLKYPLIFTVCDALIINKIDVLPYFDFDMDKVVEYAHRRNPNLKIFPISAKTGLGLDACWRRPGPGRRADPMEQIFSQLFYEVEKHRDTVLVTLIADRGSAPRKAGAQMLVGAEGRLVGTIGGGAVEGRSIQLSQQLLAERRSCIREFPLHQAPERDIGMVCGGDVTAHFQFIPAEDPTWSETASRALALLNRHTAGWLVLAEDGSAPALLDRESVVSGSLPEDTAQALRTPGFSMAAGYISLPLPIGQRALLFGAGHISQALCPLLTTIGFRPVVFDDRPELANTRLFPAAEQVICGDFTRISDYLTITDEDFVVIMTSGHVRDFQVEEQTLRGDFAYVGVIGSRRKTASVNQRLREAGIPEESIDLVHTPIGTPILAVTPEEIAVSIAGEMIRVRAQRRGPTSHGCPMHG